MPELTAGLRWAKPAHSKKFHVFDAGRSLCNGWMYTGGGSDDGVFRNEPSHDECATCHRKALKLAKAEASR